MPRSGRPSELAEPHGEFCNTPVSRAEFARMLRCAPPRVTEWVKRGTISGDALSDGLILPARAIEQLRVARCFGASAAAPTGEPSGKLDARGRPGPSYDEARTATEVLKAHVALLAIKERTGELVAGDLADGVLFDCMRAVRDAWLTWPVRVVAEMASRLEIEAAPLLAELERSVRDQLTALADPKADWRSRSQAARSTIEQEAQP